MSQPMDDPLQAEHAERDAVAVFGGSIDRFDRLTHSSGTRGVWRVGSGRSTAVLKVLSRPAPTAVEADPRAMRYWLREAFVYADGIPTPYLENCFRGPRLLARFDRSDGDVALWLEDVEGVPASRWDPAGFEQMAERLGRAQGAFLAGTAAVPAAAVPSAPWHCRGFLRQYLEMPRAFDPALIHSDEAWAQPDIARHFPADLRAALVRLHEERGQFLDWLEAVPQTFCHLDVWPGNLFAQPNETVAIDWSFCGIAATGEDPGNLVPDSVFDMIHPPSALEPIASAVWRGYLAGIRSAGWTGDERWIRLGLVGSSVKYSWIAAATLARAAAGTKTQPIYGGEEVEADRLFEVRAAVMTFLAGWADEARSIAGSLGLR